MLIRPFHLDDREELLDVFSLLIPEFFDPREKSDLDGYLLNQGDTYLTLEVEGKIIGGCGYLFDNEDDTGRITWIFFHPDTHGKGYGHSVVEYCLKELRKDKRVKKFLVNTSQSAEGFFAKFGFVTTQYAKDYWGQGFDLYRMERALI